MVVKERPDLTAITLQTFNETVDREETGLIVVDCGSDPATVALLRAAFAAGEIDRLVLNKPGTVPQWQKCYAIRQALAMLEMEEFQFFGFLDNDLRFHPYWLRQAQVALGTLLIDSERFAYEVIACHQDGHQEKRHKTVSSDVFTDHSMPAFAVRRKATANGPCWVMRRSFFQKWGLPPVGLGKCDAGVEDWYYSRIMQKEGNLFGVIDGCEHLGYNQSQRTQIPHGTVWTK